jgi:hypothetical protein
MNAPSVLDRTTPDTARTIANAVDAYLAQLLEGLFASEEHAASAGTTAGVTAPADFSTADYLKYLDDVA